MWYGWVKKANDFDEIINKLTKEESKPMNKPNNKTPKEMEGTYTLTIEGNKIKLSDKEGNVGMARCHPDDEFKLAEGMKKAFAELKKKQEAIKVGDTVEIVNPGSSYSTSDEFFVENNLFRYGVKYRYGVTPHGGEIGTVVYIDKGRYAVEVERTNYEGNDKYKSLICYKPIYLMSTHGIRKVDKQ